jgi:predicted Zn-dependent protease
MQLHDFRRVVAIAERFPRDYETDLDLRQAIATARAVSGDSAGALRLLHELAGPPHSIPYAGALAACIEFDAGDPQIGLAAAEKFFWEIPGDAFGQLIYARGLRAMGRPDEAEKVLAEIPDGPETGRRQVMRAGLAIDRGDFAAARGLIAQAEAAEPGLETTKIALAELALAEHDRDAATAAVAAAVEAVRANPLCLRQGTVRRLQERVAMLCPAPPPPQEAVIAV